MQDMLRHGSNWPLNTLNEQQQISDNAAALTFGNHKGAQGNLPLLLNLVEKDVRFGYAVTFPLAKAHLIPGVVIAPMNIMQQQTIDDNGNVLEKPRMTHDQSFAFILGTSVNSRARTDKLLPCMYGACIKRLLNWVCAARMKYSNMPIFASKVDFKSAY